ncbi:MAG: NAD(P)H-hydrate dehydratase [Candidatus Micrarchaeaceae archaeon]
MGNRRHKIVKSFSSAADLRTAVQAKSIYSNKISRGVLAVVAGSSEYHGAPSLATLAALRVGAGYVTAFVPKAVEYIVRMQSPAVVVSALGNKNIVFNERIRKAIERSDAVAIGPGIVAKGSAKAETAKILDFCFSACKKTVIDAGALRSIRETKMKPNLNAVLTPHDSEFEFVSGIRISGKGLDERIEAAVKLALRLNAVILLKGHETVITDGSKVKINRSRFMALSTMGSGDVLTGIIAGFAATGASAFQAAVAGAYLHSAIGDMLSRRMGNHIISTDIVESIPQVLKRFDKVLK